MTVVEPDRDAGRETAKQRRVREQLEELIGGLPPGASLPAERELARDLGVARMTLRRALDTLVVEARLVRRQGSGTFVAPPRGPAAAPRLAATSFSADMQARGLRPGSRTLLARESAAGMMLSSLLEVPPSSPVLHVRRLRLADDVPMALEDLHVPLAVCPGLTGADLEHTSFYDLLERRWGTPIAAGTQTIEPWLLSDEEAGPLETAPGSAAFLFERTSRLADGRVVEFVRSLYRGDRYRIMVDIFPASGPATP